MFGIPPEALQSISEAAFGSAASLFLTEAASCCTQQIRLGRKSDTEMAQGTWPVFIHVSHENKEKKSFNYIAYLPKKSRKNN